MTSYQSQVPQLVAEFFRPAMQLHLSCGGSIEHPFITATFAPRGGWKRYPGRKRISASWARRLKAQGYTCIELSAYGHRADFKLGDIIRGKASRRD